MKEARTSVEEFSDAERIQRAGPVSAGGAITFDRPLRRPRSGVEILDLALDVLRGRFATIALLCGAMWMPVAILQVSTAMTSETMFNPGAALASLFGSLTAALIGVLVKLLADAFVAVLVMGELLGRPLPLRTAVLSALRRTPGVIAVAIVVVLLAIPAYIACILPVMYVRWRTSVAPSIYVLEPVGIRESIARSFALTRGTFWRWLCVASLAYLFELSLATLVSTPHYPAVRDWLPSLGVPLALLDVVIVIVSSLLMGVALSVSSVTMTVFYDDCRLRAEGTDLAQRLEQLRAEPAR